MNVTQNIPLAVILVLIGSFCFALSAHFQHRVVDSQLDGNAHKKRMTLRALQRAIRQPRWVAGLILLGASFVLQLVAISMAPVSVVQPLGLLAFPWSVLLAAYATKTPVPPRTQLAVVVTVLATLAFTLVTSVYASAAPNLVIGRVVIGALVVYGVALLFGTLGARGSFGWRCLFWSSGGALFYGLEAALVKSLIEYIPGNDWPFAPAIWAIVVALILGAVTAGWLIQQGYATGPAELVVGSMTVTSPVVAVVFGILVLGEGALITRGPVALMVGLGLVAVGGVVALTRFHPTYKSAAPVLDQVS